MHAHDHDSDAVDALRPKAARIDDPEPARFARAASEGRWDAVGPHGMSQLQRSVGNAGVTASMNQAPVEEERSPVHDVVSSGGGRPLEPEVRADMEARLGHDFGDVRVHDDSRAHESAAAVHAHAYTVGSNVVFQRDRYDPTSHEGRITLAHELTHVVQQRSGPVDGTPAAGGIRVSDPSDRFEREASANAERVMSGPEPVTASPAAIQRETDQDEEPVQGSFVQRETDQDEEPVQGSFVQRETDQDEESLQGSFEPGAAVQREEAPEEDEAATS